MLKRNSVLKSKGFIKSSKKTIKKTSDKSLERQKKYEELRDKYLKENSICEFEGCNCKDVCVHHKEGRIGDKLFRSFMSVCNDHHRWIHDNPKEAIEKGYLIKRS